MSTRKEKRLVLTLPTDPDLARLTGLVSTHFFRQNGVTAAAARRGAHTVERRCRALLRAGARSSHQVGNLVIVLEIRSTYLEVLGRAGGGRRTRLARIDRPGLR